MDLNCWFISKSYYYTLGSSATLFRSHPKTTLLPNLSVAFEIHILGDKR